MDDVALDQIVRQFRTPRVVLAAVVWGAGLAVAALRTLVSKPLADPTVLGFSHGASPDPPFS